VQKLAWSMFYGNLELPDLNIDSVYQGTIVC